MAFSVTEFSSRLRDGGLRNNLFAVTMTFPGGIENGPIAGQELTFMAKSASVPSSTLGITPVPYFGRVINVAGDREFTPFEMTVIMTEGYEIRDAFENWSNSINSHEGNLNSRTPAEYKVDFEVLHYGKNGEVVKTYKFVGGFPTTVGEVALAWDSNNQVAEFPLTMTYDYWTASTTS